MRNTLGIGLLAATLMLGLAPTVQADSSLRAIGDWSMAPQSRDANGNGFIDGNGGVPNARPQGSEPSTTFVGAGNRIAQPFERLIGGKQSWYLSPDGFTVHLDACKSTGAQYRWRILQGNRQVRQLPWKKLTSSGCKRNVQLTEGDYRFVLEVRRGSGRSAQQSIRANVKNYIFVVVGDSYASGEGNPRNVQAWLDNPDRPFAPYYDDAACNRSTRSGPAQAALALEKSSNKSSVTFVDVSCTGATIDNGVLGPQRSAGQTISQIQQVRELIGNRAIDILVMSVGGNDVGFTSIIGTCALSLDCPLVTASTPPLSRFASVQQGVQTLTARLPAAYERIARCFTGNTCQLTDGSSTQSLTLASKARVMPMTYPDITRSAIGEPCRYLTLTRADFAWARDTILVPQAPNPYRFVTFGGATRDLSTGAGTLNGQILSTTRLGWQPVAGIWGASGESKTGHGVCAGSNSWFFGITTISGPFATAAFHPNPLGQRSIGRQIARALGVG